MPEVSILKNEHEAVPEKQKPAQTGLDIGIHRHYNILTV